MAGFTAGNILLLVAFIALIYFMMIRPQKKKEKEDAEMRAALKVGDEILTIGGVVGKVTKITEKTVVISTGAANNKIEFIKSAIASVNRGAGSAPEKKAAAPDEDGLDEKSPSRDKKVAPKKLTKKSEEAEK